MKVPLNGHDLAYDEQGPPSGTSIVFVHGFPFNRSMWAPQLAALPSGLRAVVYDVRGHGESAVGTGQYSLEFFVDDLLALLDHLEIDRTMVCGLSMGGYIALRAVERHQERFGGLVLCDTKSAADSSAARAGRAGSVLALQTRGVDAFAEQFTAAVLSPRTLENNPDLVQSVKAMITGNDPLGIAGTLLALAARTDTTPALAHMELPALVLVGEHDALTPPADAEALVAALPQATLQVIPDAAHLSNLENDAEFNRRLLDFLTGL